jgi:hypothetical protein
VSLTEELKGDNLIGLLAADTSSKFTVLNVVPKNSGGSGLVFQSETSDSKVRVDDHCLRSGSSSGLVQHNGGLQQRRGEV